MSDSNQRDGGVVPPASAVPSEAVQRARQKMVLLGVGGVVVGITTGLLLMRLSGLDRLAPGAPSPVPPSGLRVATQASFDTQPIVETGAAPQWVGRKKAVWASDGSKTIAFELPALNDVAVFSTRGRPTLVVRCLSGRTEVFVSLGTSASIEPQAGSHTVHLQIDGDAPSEQRWSDSVSSQELFAPDGVALAKRLAQARTLRFGFTPYSSKPVVADFNVRGFDELVGLVAGTCHWRADESHPRAASR